jgi:nucleoside 2-deoxyribosyltransferase
MTTKKLFLSYSRPDQDFAWRLRDRLAAMGLIVDEPASGIKAGEPWVDSIRKVLEQADAMLVVIPESGRGTANNVFFELGAARALNKPILAVIPDAAKHARRELPSDLMGMFILDADDKTIEAVANTLASTLAAA